MHRTPEVKKKKCSLPSTLPINQHTTKSSAKFAKCENTIKAHLHETLCKMKAVRCKRLKGGWIGKSLRVKVVFCQWSDAGIYERFFCKDCRERS